MQMQAMNFHLHINSKRNEEILFEVYVYISMHIALVLLIVLRTNTISVGMAELRSGEGLGEKGGEVSMA